MKNSYQEVELGTSLLDSEEAHEPSLIEMKRSWMRMMMMMMKVLKLVMRGLMEGELDTVED